MASRAVTEEHAKLMRLLANELVADAHVEAALVEHDVTFKSRERGLVQASVIGPPRDI